MNVAVGCSRTYRTPDTASYFCEPPLLQLLILLVLPPAAAVDLLWLLWLLLLPLLLLPLVLLLLLLLLLMLLLLLPAVPVACTHMHIPATMYRMVADPIPLSSNTCGAFKMPLPTM